MNTRPTNEATDCTHCIEPSFHYFSLHITNLYEQNASILTTILFKFNELITIMQTIGKQCNLTLAVYKVSLLVMTNIVNCKQLVDQTAHLHWQIGLLIRS